VIAERNLMISLLKLTGGEPVLIGDIKNDARLPSDMLHDLLKKFQNEDLLKLNHESVDVDSENRVKLAVRVVSHGADIEVVGSLLNWQEFESITATALVHYGYAVSQNLWFKHAGRRWEIDVVGCRKPLVICVDCKSWHHDASPSALRRVVEAQVERTRALSDALPHVSIDLPCAQWSVAKFVPIVLVLLPGRFKFYDEVPIVPVLQLQNFLSQLPLEVESLKYFQKQFAHLSHDSQKRRSSEPEGGNQTQKEHTCKGDE
jgi:Holliday junction resolvase-like predicted endonuclease